MGKIVLTWSKKIFFIVAFFHFQLSIHPKKTFPLTQALKMFENNFCVPILHRITIKIFRNPAPVKKQFRPFCRVPDFLKITPPPYCTVQYICMVSLPDVAFFSCKTFRVISILFSSACKQKILLQNYISRVTEHTAHRTQIITFS